MNDARGQRLFSSSVFNLRPFFFWALFLSSCVFFFTTFKNFFSSLFYALVFFPPPMAFLLRLFLVKFYFAHVRLDISSLAVCDKNLILLFFLWRCLTKGKAAATVNYSSMTWLLLHSASSRLETLNFVLINTQVSYFKTSREQSDRPSLTNVPQRQKIY